MLADEIDPFADAHIEELQRVRGTLLVHFTTNNPNERIQTYEEMDALMKKLNGAERALERFKVCMADEVQQKFLYRDRWLALKPKL